MKKFPLLLFGLFVILVLLFDRGAANAPYANYCFVLVFLASIPSINNFIHYKLDTPFIIGSLFAIYSLVSVLWGPDPAFSLTRACTVVLMQLIFVTLSSYRKYCSEAVQICLKSFVIGTLILLVLSATSISSFSAASLQTDERLSTGLMNDDNLLGKMLAIGSTICLHYFLRGKNWIFLLIYIVYAVVIVTLKSKGAVIAMLTGSIVLLFIFFQNKHKVRRFWWMLLLFAGFFLVVLNSGFFGDAFIRFTNMFGFISQDAGVIDDSTELRLYYMTYGVECFISKPIFGYGIGASDYILHGSYFHNNFIQLLVETGVIGFFIYYCLFIWMIRKLWHNRSNSECMVCLALIFLFIFSDISNTTYYSKLNYLILGISYLSIETANKRDVIGQTVTKKNIEL